MEVLQKEHKRHPMIVKESDIDDEFAVTDLLAIKICHETGLINQDEIAIFRDIQERIEVLNDNGKFTCYNKTESEQRKLLKKNGLSDSDIDLYKKIEKIRQLLHGGIFGMKYSMTHPEQESVLFTDGSYDAWGIVQRGHGGGRQGYTWPSLLKLNPFLVFSALLLTDSTREIARLTRLNISTVSETLQALVSKHNLVEKRDKKYYLNEHGKEHMKSYALYYPGIQIV